jgi:hypothetical protein
MKAGGNTSAGNLESALTAYRRGKSGRKRGRVTKKFRKALMALANIEHLQNLKIP